MNRFKALIAAGVAAASSQVPAAAATYGVYAFGDSAIEQGNVYNIPGVDQPPTPPYFRGPDGLIRDSNGPVWVEFVFPGIKAFRGPEPLRDRINFAHSGAQTGYGSIADGTPADVAYGTGLRGQFDIFRTKLSTGEIRVGRDDLFIVDAGPNDIIGAIRDGANLNDAGRDGGIAMADLARDIARLGGRTVFITDFADTGLAPIFRFADPTVTAAASEASRTGSDALRRRVGEVLQTLPGDVQIIVMNNNELVRRVFANPQLFGFANVTDPCYDNVLATLCSPDKTEQNKFLFLDNAGHPTEPGQKLLARFYAATIESVTGERHAELSAVARDVAIPLAAAQRTTSSRIDAFLTGGPEGWTVSATGGRISGDLDRFSINLDHATADLLLGASLSYAAAPLEEGKLRGDHRSGLLTIYGSYRNEGLYASVNLSGGTAKIDGLRRLVDVPTFIPTSDPDFLIGGFEIAAGVYGQDNAMAYTLGAGLRSEAATLSGDATEIGAPGLNLKLADVSHNKTTADIRGSVVLRDAAGIRGLDAGVSASAGYAIQDRTRVKTQLLGTTARQVSMTFEQDDRWEARVSPFVRWTLDSTWSLELRADSVSRDGKTENEAALTISAHF